MAKKSEDKNSIIKTIVVAVFFAVIVLLYFYSLNHRSATRKNNINKSEFQELVEYNMKDDYPKTPREVVKLHCRYYKLIYTSKLKDEDLGLMNSQMRKLYATDLLMYNSESAALSLLKADIEKVEKEDYEYRAYALPEPSQVKSYKQNGKDMATMEVTVTVGEQKHAAYVYQQYVLVKENDQWKILGWGQSKMSDQTQN